MTQKTIKNWIWSNLKRYFKIGPNLKQMYEIPSCNFEESDFILMCENGTKLK